ncbi:MAG: hypothetical protein ACKVVT_04165 [Dehalococcoidia bacterium]
MVIQRLVVVTSNVALRRALVAHLEGVGHFVVVARDDTADLERGDIVIAPTDGISPEEAFAVVAVGASLIVLAPLPSDPERDRYLAAGAGAYLPMLVDGDALHNAVARALGSDGGASGAHRAP